MLEVYCWGTRWDAACCIIVRIMQRGGVVYFCQAFETMGDVHDPVMENARLDLAHFFYFFFIFIILSANF